MKKRIFLQSLICLFAVSCSVKELDIRDTRDINKEVFYASMESYSGPDTKVYLDGETKIRWNANDLISIFNKSTLNQQYIFVGNEGENYGAFNWVESDFFGAGNDLGFICAVYPFRESTTISNSGVLTLTLPEDQTYKANSFGPEANTMVATSNDNLLKFKNVGGYLGFQFYGKDGKEISVSSIRLTGHTKEKLSGKATVTPAIGVNPEIEMAPETAGSSIILNCETPVQLGTEDKPTIFWMVVPPTDFAYGFTVTITAPNGDVFIQETNNRLTIERNEVMRVFAIPVDFDSDGLYLKDKTYYEIDEKEKGVSPVKKINYKTSVDEANRTVTVTMPTITDFSDLLFNYDHTGTGVMVNGENIEFDEDGNATTHIDASKKTDEDGFHLASLVVRNGQYGKNYTMKIRNTGLPVVRITLPTGKTLVDDIESDPDHETWLVGAKIRIDNADGTIDLDNVQTDIKGRGNATWKYPKKPYALKFKDKNKVLGMHESKRWILLANWRDRTLLRNDAAFWLSRETNTEPKQYPGLPYTVSGKFVELEINGEHRGNYYLCEQIKIESGRVEITEMEEGFTNETGGFLMEIDSYYDEVNKFLSPKFHLKYMFKNPDGDASDFGTAYTYMENFISSFETILKNTNAVKNHQYEQYLDVDSAIWFMLVNELADNRDFFQTAKTGTYPYQYDDPNNVYGPHSTYLYKDQDKNGTVSKLVMGPVWDFDYETFVPSKYFSSNGHGSYAWRGFDKSEYYYSYLCKDDRFVTRVVNLWNSKKERFKDLADYIDEMANMIHLSQQFDDEMWPYIGDQNHPTGSPLYHQNDNHDYGLPFLDPDPEVEDAIGRMKQSLLDRLDWMDIKINALLVRQY